MNIPTQRIKPARAAETMAYWAGVFDSNGFMGLTKSTAGKIPMVRIRMVNPVFWQRLTDEFGGRTCKVKRPNGKFIYAWTVSGLAAQYVTGLVMPYLVVKLDLAREIMGWRPVRNRRVAAFAKTGGAKLTAVG